MFCKKKRRPPCSASPSISLSSAMPHISLDRVREFTLAEVREFTGRFRKENLLGKGNYGHVYRGVLPDGKAVAVKRLNLEKQGEGAFLNEVEIMSRLHHEHVVSLIGYCKTKSERILVLELVPNKTLEFHLHGEGRRTLDWPTRVKIALGCAKGLAYLHEDCHPKIIHCDIMGPNILVDFDFEAKIADFGLSRCTSDARSRMYTMYTNDKDHFWYLALEYVPSGNLAEKHDIFSCGVVFLELITGCKRDSKGGSLANWARPLLTKALKDGNYSSFVDRKLQNKYDNNEMSRMVACAAACVADHRPRMSKIVRALKGDLPLSELNE